MENQKQERKKVMVMTLCHACTADFRNSGYVVVQKGFQKEKESCDFCNVRLGLTYGIFNRE
jgi:hypothetical protein